MGKYGPTPIYDIRVELQRQSLRLREGADAKAIARKIDKLGRKLEKALAGTPTDRAPDDQMTKFLDGVIGCVEANSNEKSNLWERNHNREDARKRTWESDGSGLGTCVGIIGDHQVWISLTTAVIDGHKILFYSADGRVVDYNLVRSWLNARLPATAFNGERLNNTDATNFHSVFPSSPPPEKDA